MVTADQLKAALNAAGACAEGSGIVQCNLTAAYCLKCIAQTAGEVGDTDFIDKIVENIGSLHRDVARCSTVLTKEVDRFLILSSAHPEPIEVDGSLYSTYHKAGFGRARGLRMVLFQACLSRDQAGGLSGVEVVDDRTRDAIYQLFLDETGRYGDRVEPDLETWRAIAIGMAPEQRAKYLERIYEIIHEPWDTIQFGPWIQNEYAKAVARLERDGEGTSPKDSPDGPVEPNKFRWAGSTLEMEIEPLAFKLLVFLWERLQKSDEDSVAVKVCDIGKDVWGDRRTKYGSMKSAVSKMNTSLVECDLPFSAQKLPKHDYVSFGC